MFRFGGDGSIDHRFGNRDHRGAFADDDGNLGIKTVNDSGVVEFHAADIAMSSSEGVWIAGLPYTAAIITVGQGFVSEGTAVDAIAEAAIDTAVAAEARRAEN